MFVYYGRASAHVAMNTSDHKKKSSNRNEQQRHGTLWHLLNGKLHGEPSSTRSMEEILCIKYCSLVPLLIIIHKSVATDYSGLFGLYVSLFVSEYDI